MPRAFPATPDTCRYQFKPSRMEYKMSTPIVCQMIGHNWQVKPLPNHTLDIVCVNCGDRQD